jgi:hypothetical protein
MLLLCPRAQEVWTFFHRDFGSRSLRYFADIWLAHDHTYVEATINTAIAWTIWKRRNALPSMELRRIFPLSGVVLKMLDSGLFYSRLFLCS